MKVVKNTKPSTKALACRLPLKEYEGIVLQAARFKMAISDYTLLCIRGGQMALNQALQAESYDELIKKINK
jgi:hypothetical protein